MKRRERERKEGNQSWTVEAANRDDDDHRRKNCDAHSTFVSRNRNGWL